MRSGAARGRFDEEDVLRLIEDERITVVVADRRHRARASSTTRASRSSTCRACADGLRRRADEPGARGRRSTSVPVDRQQHGQRLRVERDRRRGVVELRRRVRAARRESPGAPTRRATSQICDERGQPVPDGVEGEIHVRSAYNMFGYWNDADATARRSSRALARHRRHRPHRSRACCSSTRGRAT